MNLKRAVFELLATSLLAVVTAQASAQPYPSRPLRIVVPTAAGGTSDIFARAVAQYLHTTLKQPVLVENRPGAGLMLGAEVVAKSAPDGYTMLLLSNSHLIQEALDAKRNYVLMRDLQAVAPLYDIDLVLVVSPSLPARTLKELIDLAKAKPNTIYFGSTGNGTSLHLAGEFFKSAAGIEITHVPYKSAVTARVDLMSSQVQMMFDLLTSAGPLIAANRLRALAVGGPRRSEFAPNLPTMAELGFPQVVVTVYGGIAVPAGTPAPIVARLNAELRTFLEQPETKDIWAKQAARPFFMTAEAFTAYLKEDIARWSKVVKAGNLKPEE